jgi:hypothetical protein
MIAHKPSGFHLSVRRGMTLTEMLVATAMTLVIMGVVVQLFGMVGKGVSSSRASLDMSMQLRAVAHTLRTDLNGITVETVPPVKVDSDSGYLEIIEGSGSDTSQGFKQLTGDIDDVLMFTTKSMGKPFVGKFGTAGGLIESPYAEVAWYCEPAKTQPVVGSTLYNLHRRQLLVMDYVGAGSFHGTNTLNDMIFPTALGEIPRNGLDDNGNGHIDEYFDITLEIPQNDLDDNNNGVIDEMNGPALLQLQADYDLSVRRVNADAFPNGLADLSKRENRFLHNFSGIVSPTAFPYGVEPFPDFPSAAYRNTYRLGLDEDLSNVTYTPVSLLGGYRAGEDIVLGNVLAFDVRVFDPTAKVRQSTLGVAVVPGDPGYSTNLTELPSGAYIDMGVLNGGTFNSMNARSQLQTATYDTWSDHYEFNGTDEDSEYGIDQKHNQLDDDSNGIVDDSNELETLPPYAVPLRGVEVRIRIYDNSTRQVRQVTVRHTFVPH